MSEAATGGVRCSMKKGVLKNFQNSKESTCIRAFFHKVVVTTLLKKRLRHKCFLVSFAKFLRTLFFEITWGRLRLPCQSRKN